MLYHKIQSLFFRDPATKHKTFLHGEWSMPEFELLANVHWVWSEKVDGTNVRVIWDGESVTFGGRTENAQLHTGLFAHLRWVFPEVAFDLGLPPMTLFGEGFGEKIQKGGGNYCKGQGFVLFDVMCGGVWLDRDNVEDIADKLGVPVVPIVGTGTLHAAVEYVKSAPNSTWGDFTAEGIVLRPRVELQTRRGERIITKLKVRDFPSKERGAS